MERQFIDICEETEMCGDLKLKVHLDPVRNCIQEHSVTFPWVYRIRSTVLYLEELEPERRILDAYLKGERASKGTVLFRPYKKPYTSCVMRKFVLEDPYDPKRAILKYCRERPMRFVIFSKPGLNVDSLAIALSRYWGALHINPQVAVNTIETSNIVQKTKKSLRQGHAVGVTDILSHVREKLACAESKKRGYILTGLPMRQHMDSDFHILEQMEMIFETENRPDIIIYVSSPSRDIRSLNETGFICDITTGFYFNKSYIKDGTTIEANAGLALDALDKSSEHDYDYFLLKELENYNAMHAHGLPIDVGKLPSYSANLIEDYVKKILPIIDSYVLEYDTQCVVKLDGRVPVANMLEIVKAKLSTLPYIPTCKAKPMFDEVIEPVFDTESWDDRSEDSMLEDMPEPELDDEPDEETESGEEEGEEEEERQQEEEEDQEEVVDEDGTTRPLRKVNKELHHLNNMVPDEALRRMKDHNKVDQNFKWSASDYGVCCPIEFERGNICLGSPKYTCTYLGSLYMMSSLEAMLEFLSDPNRYATPPKPFPTFKIFVMGPPWSGKTSIIRSLSQFFDLKVIYTKKLIQEIHDKKFFDLEIRELVRKQKKLEKVQDVEDEIFNSYERRRCTDILNWIREQLPFIYQRIRFTSLIQIPNDDEVPYEMEMSKEENEEEESEVEEVKVELIIPMQDDFIKTVNRLTKPDLKTIIALKKYTVDLPFKSGYEKIYENIDTDQHSMLLKAISYDDANLSMNILKEEFKERGLDFFLNINEYIDMILTPARLLTYLPNQYRQPYYISSPVHYDDPRVRDPHTNNIGIRSEFGFISVKAEDLADKFEEAILDIEAENNLRQKGDDLQIGGWIIDNVPLDKTFWDLLVDRYLLPDDIVIKTVPPESSVKVLQNFCAVVSPDESNIDKNKKTQEVIGAVRRASEESLKDVEVDRFLLVRNSFLQVNKNYETVLEDTGVETPNVPKTCRVEKEQGIVTQEVLDHLPKPKEKTDEKVKYLFSTEKSAGLHAETVVHQQTFENPFILKTLPVRPYHLHFWDDDKFLVEVYQEITEHRLNSKRDSVEVETLYVAEECLNKTSTEFSLDNRKATIPSLKKDLISETPCSSESLSPSNSNQSISSSDASIGKVIPYAASNKKSYLAGKTRPSLLKKYKTKREVLSVYAAVKASHYDALPPEGLFELHGKVILDVPKTKSSTYDLFHVFYREIDSHIDAEPKTFELKRLTEIKMLLANGADLMEVANAMVKYLRKVKKTDESQDNIFLKRPSVDIEIDTGKKMKATSALTDVFSQTDTRGRLRRTGSKIQIDHAESLTSTTEEIHKDSSLSRMSHLPLIENKHHQSLTEEEEPLGSNIRCYKDSDEDIFKSSSVLLNVEMLPSEKSENQIPGRNEGWTLHLPKIDGSVGKIGRHSCYCLHPQKKTDICLCSSSSSNSEIEAGRKENKLCIYDDLSLPVLPWVPLEVETRDLRPEELIEPLRRGRQITSMRTIETVDKVRETQVPSHLYKYSRDRRAAENGEEDDINTLSSSFEEETEKGGSTTTQDVEEGSREADEISQDDMIPSIDVNQERSSVSKNITNTSQDGYTRASKASEKRLSTYEEQGSTTDIKHISLDSSAASVLYKTSTEDIVKPEEYSKRSFLDDDKIKLDEDENSPSIYQSEVLFRSEDTLTLTLDNIEGCETDTLLPGFTGNDWERFINFINSLYLSVSTYTSLGFTTDSRENFYLECCPSSSDTSIKNYLERPSVFLKKPRQRWGRFMKSEVSDRPSQLDFSGSTSFEEEEICLLEVALPVTETQMNTALNTTLKCLTLGKTLSELFSANTHDKTGRQRLTTSVLNIMYNDDTVRDIKTASETFGLDRHSDVMPIDDVSSSDAIFNEHGQLVQDNQFIELYDGNLLRYRSLDERFRPSVDMLADADSDTDQEDETDACPEIFLSTVPRAILHIPYIVPRFRPVTDNKRVTSKHLRRYYSLQSMCRMVCVDSDQEFSKPEPEHEQQEEEGREVLKFRYILQRQYTKTFESIYIHRPLKERKSIELGNEEEEEEGEEEEGEGETDKEEERSEGLKLIQDIIEPLIDVFREEIIKAEMIERISKVASEGELPRSNRTSVLDHSFETEDRTAEETSDFARSDLEPLNDMNGPDEIEEEIEKQLTFAYPYDIIKLMFQKYDFIAMELPENDLDETLITELNNLQMPKRFRHFLTAFDYNVRRWLDEWDDFKKDVLSNVQCNLIDVNFVPFKENCQSNLSNSIAKLLRNYEPQAECVDLNKEKLIKTINLETEDLDVDELEDMTDVDAEVSEIKEKDIGDVEICELLPDEYSDFHPYCPIMYNKTNELVPVNNSYSAEYRDKYFNFSTEEDMNEFIKFPEHYSAVKERDYKTTPVRICVVAPRDFDETFHIGRSLADSLALPFKTLTVEMKRIQGRTLNLPVGVFDEDQTNIKTFGLDESKEDPQEDILENYEWDHMREYFNLRAPLTDAELEALTEPLWKADYGQVFHAFPHSFDDLEYLVRKKTVPDVIVFIDVEDQRKARRKEIEERIKARQLLNFGARLKRLLSVDHLRYNAWKESYPKLFNIVLRKFLRERRAERNFRERLNLVLPTLMSSTSTLDESEEMEEYEDVRAWDVEWLLYQVAGSGKETKSLESSKVQSALDVRKVKKYLYVLDDLNLNEDEKKNFLEHLKKQKITAEVNQVQELVIEEQDDEGGSMEGSCMLREQVNLSDTEFPNVRSIFEPSDTNVSQALSLCSKNKDTLITESEEQMNTGIKIVNRRQVAVTDMFDPPFQNKYLPKFRQMVYKSERPFDREDYKKNVTGASSTSLLGHDETDSIETRELTSSLSLLDVESRNKQVRLMQLVLGNKIALKDHFMDIVKQFKESHPTPPSNARKLKTIGFKHLTKQLREYYKTERDHVKRMKDLCETQHIPYVVHKTTSRMKYLAQNVKNVIRKPHAFERVYIISYKTANRLLESGFYFLSKFGYWCPVQLYDHQNPYQEPCSDNVKEHAIIPIIHKRYIYFIKGRHSAIRFAESPFTYIKQQDTLTFFPIKVAITGIQKSRKTYLAKSLAREHGLKYISIDSTIRYVLEKLHWSDLAGAILAELRRGEIVSHANTIRCIEAVINGSSAAQKHGWVLDGFPNTIDELILMRENDIVPNVLFGMEPAEDQVKEIFCGLDEDRTAILNDVYHENEFVNVEGDEQEDQYYESMRRVSQMAVDEAETNQVENEETSEKQFYEYDDADEEEEEEEYGDELGMVQEETPESIYVRRIKELLSARHSLPIEPIRIPDFDAKLIDFELNSLIPPAEIVETRMLRWLKNVKTFDRVTDSATAWWGNSYKLQWTKDTTKLLQSMDEILTAFVWALQDYNLKISKGFPASLYLTGISEEEYRLHKSPFNDCCPGCWYYYHVYFRCPTCLFKDMMPGMVQYENYFYWVCIQHYDMFLTNPVKFLMSYNAEFGKNYPEKTVIGESFLENNLNVQYDGLCITCYYNHLPELKHVKGYGKYSVIINKTNIYLFCSNKCVCEMLMRPVRYLNLEIEYLDESKLPAVRNIQGNNVMYKRIFEQLVTDAIYDCVRQFLFLRPKLFKLSHKTSACTYLALHLKLKSQHISRCELLYYKKMLKHMEKHCQEVETFCRNIDQIFAFHGPLSVIEQAKAKCLPRDVQDILLKNLLPQHRRKNKKNLNKPPRNNDVKI